MACSDFSGLFLSFWLLISTVQVLRYKTSKLPDILNLHIELHIFTVIKYYNKLYAILYYWKHINIQSNIIKHPQS